MLVERRYTTLMKRRFFCLFPFFSPAAPLIAAKAIAERHDNSEDTEQLRVQLAQAQHDYKHACETIAKMHAAAMGEVTGPKRGVIEDGEQVRLDKERLLGLTDALTRQCSVLADLLADQVNTNGLAIRAA